MMFGITDQFTCSYLPEQQEQLLVLADHTASLPTDYGKLIQLGFRRSGSQIYRPHCPSCKACQSVRIIVDEFSPSRSQKRVHKKCSGLTTRLSSQPRNAYYALYEKYIERKHKDGSMYPPNRDQYNNFILCTWRQPLYVEGWHDDKLIAVAVTDVVDDNQGHRAFSALYTFYDTDYIDLSPGTWMILNQVAYAREQQCRYLYLGYYVGDCQKMSYKHQFYPYETFINDKWHRFDKKPAG